MVRDYVGYFPSATRGIGAHTRLLCWFCGTPNFKEAKEHAAMCEEAFGRSRDALELHMIKHGCEDSESSSANHAAHAIFHSL
jgi:hypothetical protein